MEGIKVTGSDRERFVDVVEVKRPKSCKKDGTDTVRTHKRKVLVINIENKGVVTIKRSEPW